MAPLRPAVHRTILVVDVAGFGDPRRTNRHQLVVRQGLYDILRQAFDEAGIAWPDCDHEDRGDGVLVVIPPTVVKSALVEVLPGALVTALRAHNKVHQSEEQIRLRMALHAGEIHYDEHGVVGRAVNLAFRLLDAQPLRAALAGSTGLLAVITSAWFFDEVVWHSQAADRDAYHRVRVTAKETDTVAWIRLPDCTFRPVFDAGAAVDRLPHVPRQLPTNTRQFVGRRQELDRLMGLLDGSAADGARTVVITAIDGSAGVGKTSLALHWAHRIKDRFPDGHLHVNLRGFDPREPMEPDQALHGFLQALGAAPDSIPADVDAKAALYRSLLAGRRMLIVLDNARSTDHVRPLLPGAPSCVAIITSRNRLDSLTVREGAHRIALDVLPARDARALLAERVGPDRLDAEPRTTAELLELCVRLPLALSIAAARAAGQPSLPMAGLVRELRDERSRLDVLDLGDTDLSMRAVFSWSYNLLSPPAARLFRLLGVHPGPDVDAPACAAMTGIPQVTALLRELTGAHLLTEHAPGRFRFHDLLRAYATELAEREPERGSAGEAMLDYYLRAASLADRCIQPSRGHLFEPVPPGPGTGQPRITSYSEAMAWFTAEHPTLLTMIAFAGDRGHGTFAWQLAWACTTFLRRVGRYQDRVTVHRLALAATRRSDDRAGQATALRHLASAIARTGQLDEALDHLREAGELFRSARDEAGEVDNHLAYARVFEAQGRPAEALEHAQLAWDLVRRSDNRLGHADALNAMGHQLSLLAHHAEALPLCKRALALYSADGHPEGVADVLMNIGDIERNLGRHAVAVDFYRRSLELDRELGDRYWEAMALERLSDAYRAIGEPLLAEEILRASLAILREIRHPDAERLRTKVTASSG